MTINQLFLNFARALRLIRVINYNPESLLGPLCMDVSITSCCNYQCYFCTSHSPLREPVTRGVTMPYEWARCLFRDFAELRVREVLLSGDGEPLLVPYAKDLVDEFSGHFSIKVLTNGSSLGMITPEFFGRLAKLTCSLNSITPDTHKLVHGYGGESQLETILTELKRLLSYPHARRKIQVNYVMISDNRHEFSDLVRFSRDWNVRFAVRPVHFAFDELRSRMLSTDDLASLRGQIASYLHDPSLPSMTKASLDFASLSFTPAPCPQQSGIPICYSGFYWGNVWSNGDYTQCVNRASVLGNIGDTPFKDIWRSPPTQEHLYSAALMHKSDRPVYPSCRGCSTPQVYSAPFHRILACLPLQLVRIRNWKRHKKNQAHP